MKKKKKTGHDDSADLRKRAEEALRESEEEYRNLVERANDGIVIVQDGIVKYINARLAEMRGVTVEEVIGTPFTDHIYPDELPEVVDRYKQRMAGEDVSPIYETALRRRDGSKIHAELNAGMVTYQGKPADLVIIRDITERKRAEEALRYQAVLLANTYDAIIASDEHYRLTAWNAAAESLYGWKAEEVLGRLGLDVIQTEFPGVEKSEMLRTITEIGHWRGEVTQARKDGTRIPVEVASIVLYDESGRITGYLSVNRDITERKRAEEAVRKSEEKFRSLTGNVNLGIYRNTVGPEGQFIEANPAIIGMSGYKSKEEFLAINVSDLYQNPEDRNKFNDKMLKEGFVRGEELRLKKKDGSLYVGSVSAVAVKDEQGHVKYYDGIIEDITERKRVEDALRFTRLSLDNAADTMVCVGYDARFVDVNDAFCRSLGYSREELLSMTVHDIDPDYSAEVWPEFWKKLKQSGSLNFETCHHTKAGKAIPVEITAKFFEHNGKEYHCGFARDITERKRAEEEIRQKAKDLQEKNAELTRFIYAVSHDLRSPLVTIQTFQGHLEGDIRSQDAARVEKDLGYIRNAADKMGRLLNELLRFSRVGRIMNPSEEAPLQAIVKEALDLVAGRITGRGVRIDLTEEPVVLYGDRTRLVEVFLNLVDNAVKFMGDEPTPRVEIGVEQAGEELVLHVRDNGIGIDPRLRPMLFGLFHKLDSETEGEGIGLALVKQIVELHGGRIWVESAGIGTGATFRFTLAKTRHKRGREETA